MPTLTKKTIRTRRSQGFLWAHMCWWMKVDEDSEHTLAYYKKWCPDLCKDPVHRWLEKLPHHLSDHAVRRALSGGRDELAGLGGVRPHDSRAAFHVAGEFRQSCLGISLARHA